MDEKGAKGTFKGHILWSKGTLDLHHPMPLESFKMEPENDSLEDDKDNYSL